MLQLAFADPPEPIDSLSPISIPGTKKVLERPRFAVIDTASTIVCFRKPADARLFSGRLRRHASTQALVGTTGRILDARPDFTYNCHYHTLGQSIGLPRLWIDGQVSPLTMNTNPVAEILSQYYDQILVENNPDNIATSICHNDEINAGDVVMLKKQQGGQTVYAHSMLVVYDQAAECIFDSKIGEEHLVRTEIQPILREYEGLFDSAVVVRRRYGTGPAGFSSRITQELNTIQASNPDNGGVTAGAGACNVIRFNNEAGYNLGSTLPWCTYSAALQPGSAWDSGQISVNLRTISGAEASVTANNIAIGDFAQKMEKMKMALEQRHPNWRADILDECSGSQPGPCMKFRYQHQTEDRAWEAATQISIQDNTSGSILIAMDSDDDRENTFVAKYSMNLGGPPLRQPAVAAAAVPGHEGTLWLVPGHTPMDVIQMACSEIEYFVHSLVCSGSGLDFKLKGGETSYFKFMGPPRPQTLVINNAEVEYCGLDCPDRPQPEPAVVT